MPALIEDRAAVRVFDVPVGLRAAGADLRAASVEAVAAELVGAVDEQPLEAPARCR